MIFNLKMRNTNINNNKSQNNKVSLTQYSNSLIKNKNKKPVGSITIKDDKFNMLKLLMNDINDMYNKKSIKRNLKQSFSNENISSNNGKPKLNINFENNDIINNKFRNNKKNKNFEETFKLEYSTKKNQIKHIHKSFVNQKELTNQNQNHKNNKNNKNALSFDNLLDINNKKTKVNNNTYCHNSSKKINSFRLQTNSVIEKKMNLHPYLSSNNSKSKKTIKPKQNSFVFQNKNSENEKKNKKKFSISLKKKNIQQEFNIENNRNSNFNDLVSKCEKLKEKTSRILANYLSIIENKIHNS